MEGPLPRHRTGYSRLVRWMKILLPLGALGTIGAIFVVGQRLTDTASLLTAEEMATLGAGLRLETPRFSGRTDSGEPYVLRAAWALPDSAMPTEIELERPEGEIETEDGRRIEARADSGVMNRRRNDLMLRGDVVLTTSDGYRVETARLALDLERRGATAPGPIAAEGPAGSLEAGRMRLDHGDDGEAPARILFEERVRVVFIPRASR